MRAVFLAPSFLLLIACGESELIGTNVRLALTHSGRQSQALTSSAAACTPINLSGRIFSGGAMWGELGPEAFNVTMLGADEDVILNPSEGMGGSLSFSLIEATVLSGLYASPGGGADKKPLTRMEFNYDFVDTTIDLDLPNNPMDGRWIVRTVFVTQAESDDVDGTMQRGDKLIRRPNGERFVWCDADACDADRGVVASGIIQESKLVEAVFPGQGNPAYVPFTVPVKNELMLSGDELEETDATWSAAFDMTDAVLFHSPLAMMTTPSMLLASFELSYEPDQAHAGEETRIAVDLNFEY